MKLAFIDAVFPGLTTTFILREFEYLKNESNIEVYPFSIKKPSKEMLNREYRHYVSITKYLRPDCLIGIFALNIKALILSPIKYLKILRLFTKEVKKHPSPVNRKTFFHFLCGIYLGQYLKKNNYNHIHAHFSSASTIAMVAYLYSGIKYTFTIHANELYTGSILLQSKIEYAPKVITNNSYNKHHINLLTYYKYDQKIKVIYNGIDINDFKNSQSKIEPSEPIRFLSIGSFTGFKGYPTVLSALRKLKDQNIKFHYKIIGGGAREEKEMIERLIEKHELHKEVELLGRQSFTRVKEELSWSDVEIMASEIHDKGRRDGLPNVIIEAMLSKRLVVSTYISDIPNIIEDGKNGFLFPEKNSDKLADILIYINNNFDETREIVENAYNFAVEKFDSQKNYASLVSILEQ